MDVPLQEWQTIGHKVPLLVNLQPAGEYLSEDFHHAGGVPAVVNILMEQGLIKEKALTANGKTMGENCKGKKVHLPEVIWPFDKPHEEGCRFHRADRQSVRQRHHEDQRDQRGIPQALSVQPQGSRSL